MISMKYDSKAHTGRFESSVAKLRVMVRSAKQLQQCILLDLAINEIPESWEFMNCHISISRLAFC